MERNAYIYITISTLHCFMWKFLANKYLNAKEWFFSFWTVRYALNTRRDLMDLQTNGIFLFYFFLQLHMPWCLYFDNLHKEINYVSFVENQMKEPVCSLFIYRSWVQVNEQKKTKWWQCLTVKNDLITFVHIYIWAYVYHVFTLKNSTVGNTVFSYSI